MIKYNIMSHPIINPQTYLKDLIEYANLHIKKGVDGGEEQLSVQDLESFFHQPFGALLQLGLEQDIQLAQIRICVEVLRKFLGNRPLANETLEQALAQSESEYLETAYHSILLHLSISFEELEQLNNSDEDTQVKLAGRLGIPTPRLQELSANSTIISESFLQQIFGLADTSDVTTGEMEEPSFLRWRKEYIEFQAEQLFGQEDSEDKNQWVQDKNQKATDVLSSVVGKTEHIVLPLLRSALSAATEKPIHWLSEKLMIDCEYDPDFEISRFWQAVITLQLLMRSMRTGLLKDTQPDLIFDAPRYLEEWKWLGNYQSWSSAMMAWLYPENLLTPSLKKDRTPIFNQMVSKLRKNRYLQSGQAFQHIQDYQQYFKDVCQLEIEATCEAETFNGNNSGNTSKESLLYQFGRSASGKIYLSKKVNENCTYWEKVPGLEDFEVSSIVGATVYEISENKKFLYLFFLGEKELFHNKTNTTGLIHHLATESEDENDNPLGNVSMAFTIYDLHKKEWSAGFEILFERMSTQVKILLEQRIDLRRPPQFIFLSKHGVWKRRFDINGQGWIEDDNDFRLIMPGNNARDIFALLFLDNKHHIFIKWGTNTLRIASFSGGSDNWENSIMRTVSNSLTSYSGLLFRSSKKIWCFLKSQNGSVRVSIGFENDTIEVENPEPFLPDIDRIVFHTGAKRNDIAVIGENEIIYRPRYIVESSNNNTYFFVKHGFLINNVNNISLIQLLPLKVDFFDLAPGSTQGDLQTRQNNIRKALERNQEAPNNILTYLWEAYYYVPLHLALQLKRSRNFSVARDFFRIIYDYTLPVEKRKIFFGLVKEETTNPQFEQPKDWYLDPLNPHSTANLRPNAYTKFTLLSLIRCFLENADAEFARDTLESISAARLYYITANELLETPELGQSPGQWVNGIDIPGNPLVISMRFHAEINLFKIHTNRNIAGDQRDIQIQSSTPTLSNIIPSQAILPFNYIKPTPFRYQFIIERAKQLVSIAQQIEAAFLSTLEKLDAERLNLLNAKNELEFAEAGIRLLDLRIKEAHDNRGLANLQKIRSQIQRNHYEKWISEGLLESEKKAIEGLETSMAMGMVSNSMNAFISLGVMAAATVATVGLTALGALGALGGSLLSLGSSLLGGGSEEIDKQKTLASYERRRSEWELQRSLANQDIQIATQQVKIAEDQIKVVNQERNIAFIRTNHAEEVMNFLSNKFTNEDLYDWMSEILEDVYSFFLQQATAMGKLAANQLAFERQEPIPSIILSDYWEPPQTAQNNTVQIEPENDRKGLTGSSRLLRDIYQLDQLAFQTEKRKLELTKNISLAQLSPAEFQEFRETGVFRFHTPMELFDWDFPGHYLRLIKRVRVSVIALTSPTEGIHATLTSTGISKAILQNGASFVNTEIRRPPESIALSSPLNTTGLFELQQDQAKLLPFESLGVQTFWEFRMPKASNRFDYRTLADILLTIEYTALNSDIYRNQVIESLDRSFSADRPFSFRQEFADQWYDLNNPELVEESRKMKVSFEVRREDFPPNLEGLQMRQLVLYFSRKDGSTEEITGVTLTFNGQEGTATSNNGMISTRQPNGDPWLAILNSNEDSPLGEWALSLPNDEQVINRFKEEGIEDILFVITYEGLTPEWP